MIETLWRRRHIILDAFETNVKDIQRKTGGLPVECHRSTDSEMTSPRSSSQERGKSLGLIRGLLRPPYGRRSKDGRKEIASPDQATEDVGFPGRGRALPTRRNPSQLIQRIKRTKASGCWNGLNGWSCQRVKHPDAQMHYRPAGGPSGGARLDGSTGLAFLS